MRFTAPKRRTGLRESAGFTLLEVTIAMGVFALVMASAAQVLLSFSSSMNIQEQRQQAVQHCRAVLTQMRQDRDTSVLPFPNQIVGTWPNGRQINDPNLVSLSNEIITVTYANAAADPLQVTVTSRWNDMQGRAVSATVSTLLTGSNR